MTQLVYVGWQDSYAGQVSFCVWWVGTCVYVCVCLTEKEVTKEASRAKAEVEAKAAAGLCLLSILCVACMYVCLLVCMVWWPNQGSRRCVPVAYREFACLHVCIHVCIHVFEAKAAARLLLVIVCMYVCFGVSMYICMRCGKRGTAQLEQRPLVSCVYFLDVCVRERAQGSACKAGRIIHTHTHTHAYAYTYAHTHTYNTCLNAVLSISWV